MNIVEHNDTGATIHLDQRELLMMMALVQEGRDSFECNGHTGRALDQLFSSASVLVEEARRHTLRKKMSQQKISTVVTPEEAMQKDGSNG